MDQVIFKLHYFITTDKLLQRQPGGFSTNYDKILAEIICLG